MLASAISTDYIEKDCKFEFVGRSFESGGASIVRGRIVAYLGKDGVLTDWHGNQLGTYRIVSSWPTPRSHVSTLMNQVHATVAGKLYKGRSAGVGMAFAGRTSYRR